MTKHYFCICFQPFKDIKMFLAHRCYKNGQQTGHSPYTSLSTPNLKHKQMTFLVVRWIRMHLHCIHPAHCREHNVFHPGFHPWSQRFHTPWGKYAQGPPLRLHSTEREPQLLKPMNSRVCAQEKPPQREGFSPPWRVAFHLPQLEKGLCA